MDADSFAHLALRVLSGDADESEKGVLTEWLAGEPDRRREFEELREVHAILQATLPLAEAGTVTQPTLPSYRVNELRTAVCQQFGPAAQRRAVSASSRFPFLRWLLAGGSLAAATCIVAVVFLSNRAIEVGLYRTERVRGDNSALTPADLPAARVITFERDAAFDQWQKTLAWNERAKIWADNEKDLLHVLHRDLHGKVVEETSPLAATEEEQRVQIDQAVKSVR